MMKTGLNFSTQQREPLLKYHTIPVIVKRFFTDVDGVIQDKNTITDNLKTDYPFFVFGDFDRQGGYNTGLKVMPTLAGQYMMTFVEGNGVTSQTITGFNGFNNVRSQIKVGDIVHVYTDSLTAPQYFIWIILSSVNGSIASMVGNSETHQRDGVLGKLYMDHFQYFTDNADAQWNKAINFVRSTNIASFSNNPVQPYIFKTPYTEQDGFIRIGCHFNLDQYQSIGTYFLFATEEIQFIFMIGQKI